MRILSVLSIQSTKVEAHAITRDKYGKAVRCSGGIAVAVKMSLKQGITVLPSDTPDIVWLKLDEEFFKMRQELFVAFVYNSPKATSYWTRLKKSVLTQLREDVARLPTGVRILIMGDLNSRIGRRSARVEYCREDLLPHLQGVAQQGSTKDRHSEDTLEKDGEQILELCMEGDMTILRPQCHYMYLEARYLGQGDRPFARPPSGVSTTPSTETHIKI